MMATPAEKKIEPHPEPSEFILRSFILCLSFANLSFLNLWEGLLNRHTEFFRKYAATWQELVAVIFDVLLLAVVLWIPVFLIARSRNPRWIRILKWCVLAGLMFPLNVLRLTDEVSSLSSLPTLQTVPVRVLLAALGVSAGLILLWKWERLSTPVTSAILIILAPVLPLVVASLAWGIYTGPPAGRLPDKIPALALPQKPHPSHVLWFIFDEWDQALTFVRRPANLELPELDRFRSQSFHAGRAFSPSRQTLISVPSLLTGKTFVGVQPKGASELLLIYERNQPPERLTTLPTVFSQARGAGFNVGIGGFYLPYCRLFDTTSCEWHSAIGFLPVEWELSLPVGRLMVLAAERQLPMIPFARRLGLTVTGGDESSQNPSLHAVTYRQTRDAALRLIIDSRLNLVFVHWNIPHMPAIYNAAKDDFSGGPPKTYLDNLRLVDRTLRDIRLTLEKAGVWDSSTILLTSDHPLRLSNRNLPLVDASVGNTQGAEVPFLLKLAGETQGFAYDAPMQTVVTKDLLLAIMKGEVSQPMQVAAWLDRNPPRR